MRKRRALGRFRNAGTVATSGAGATAGAVAVVVALLALGALGLLWQDSIALDARRLSGRTLLIAAGIVLGIGLALTLVAIALSGGRGAGPQGKPRKPMSMVAVVLTFAVLALLLWLMRDRLADLFGAAGKSPERPPREGGGAPPPGAEPPPPQTTWSWSVAIAAGFVLGLLTAVGYLFARRVEAADAADTDEPPTVEDVQRVVAAGRAALSDLDEPRAAVIRSYAAMESALADLGLSRRVADTPSDLLTRAERAGLFGTGGAAAAHDLAELFQRARFSHRELPPDARLAAVDALNRLEGELRRTAAAQARPSKAVG